MYSNQDKQPSSKSKHKGKEQELAERNSDDKRTDKKGKAKNQGHRDGAVLGEINDD